ncbi:MAG: HemK/PrmC family methyltransferase, partial [Nitrospirota bacterium]
MRPLPEPEDIASLLFDAGRMFARAGIESPNLEAQALMAFVLGTNRAGVFSRLKDIPDDETLDAFHEAIDRRARREPLQYITGTQEFCSLAFSVNPDVLIPRPETELLVQEALSFLSGKDGVTAADIGTGSGCIAVTLAYNLPGLSAVAIDSSKAALDTAIENARRHGVEGRVRSVQGDLFRGLNDQEWKHGFDLVVSNLPYVPRREILKLMPEVQYEPI